MTRVIYMTNFFNVSFTLYNFIRDFSKREVDVLNIKIIGYILLGLNIFVYLHSLIAFIIFASYSNKCHSDHGSLEAWNTWISVTSIFVISVLVLVLGIILIIRYRRHIEHILFPDSKKMFIIYIIASIFILFESIMRVICHLYYPITHRYMNNTLYQALIHWIPDFIEMICLCLLFLYIIILI